MIWCVENCKQFSYLYNSLASRTRAVESESKFLAPAPPSKSFWLQLQPCEIARGPAPQPWQCLGCLRACVCVCVHSFVCTCATHTQLETFPPSFSHRPKRRNPAGRQRNQTVVDGEDPNYQSKTSARSDMLESLRRDQQRRLEPLRGDGEFVTNTCWLPAVWRMTWSRRVIKRYFLSLHAEERGC